MGHKCPTPNHLRPTLEEVEIRDFYAQRRLHCAVEIRGLWSDSEEEFKVIVSGHGADVREAVECIKDDGNLMGIEVTQLEYKEGG